MAVTFESITTNTGTSAAPTFNMPTTRPDGDLYIAILAHDDDDEPNAEWPTNWIGVVGAQDLSATGPTLYCWLWEGSSEPTSYSINITGSEDWFTAIIRLSGADNDQPVSGVGIDFFAAPNTTAPSVNTNDDNTFVIRAIAVDADEVTATPATERAKGLNSTIGYGVSTEAGPVSAGSTGTAQFTHASDTTASFTLAIRPERASIAQEVASQTYHGNDGFSSSSANFYHHPTKPDSDLYIALLATGDDNTFSGIPAGWTERFNEQNSTASVTGTLAAWSFTGSSEPSSYSVTMNEVEAYRSSILRIADGDTTDPIDVTGFNVSGTVNTLDAPSVTTTNNNTLVLRVLTTPGSMSLDSLDNTDDFLGVYTINDNNITMLIKVEEGPNPAGSTGTHSFTWNDNATAIAATIAINLTTAGNTFEESITLSEALSVSALSAPSFFDEISLRRALDLAPATDVSWQPSITLDKATDFAIAEDAIFEAVILLDNARSLIPDASISFDRSINLSWALSLEIISGLTQEATLDLARALSLSPEATTTTERSILLDHARALDTLTELVIDRSISLDKALALLVERDGAIEIAIEINRAASIAVARALTIPLSVLLDHARSISPTAEATFEAAFQLSMAKSLPVAAGIVHEHTFNLSYALTIEAISEEAEPTVAVGIEPFYRRRRRT